MEDLESAPRIARKSSAISHSAGRNGVNSGTTRITDAQCLSLAQQLVILDESTELPPFGMCMSGLQERLKRRLGLEIAESAIKACLSPYYDLAEWEDRYITKSLGVEVEEFGSANHPPRSPLKEFCLSSNGEVGDGSDDGYDGEHTAVPAGSGTTISDHAVDLGRAGGGSVDGGGGSAGDKMQEGEEQEEEKEDAATGAGVTGGGELGTGNVGGGRVRSGSGAGGGAAVAPVPAKAADAAGSKASSHIARPTTQRAGHNAPSSSTGELFQRAEKHPHKKSQWRAGGGGAIEVDGMEVQ